MLTVTYEELGAALAACNATTAAAAAHGSLCGALAAVPGLDAADWLAELLPETGPRTAAPHAHALLVTLFAETGEALAGQQMEFAPLLPDDATPIEQRTAALAEWCSGFLYGLGTATRAPGATLPAEVREVLRDFGEISRACVGGEDADIPEDPAESHESAYAELVEYLRAGTQLVFEELVPLRAGVGAS